MIQRSFSVQDQAAFAALSGDYNPIHLDEVVARRLIFGAPVVHGVHLFLWCLDALCEPSAKGSIHLLDVKAVFNKPVAVGDAVLIEQVSARPAKDGMIYLKAKLIVNDAVAASFAVTYCESDDTASGLSSFRDSLPERVPSRFQSEKQISETSDSLPLFLKLEAAVELFPKLARHLLLVQLASILATTRIVGVYCPGLNSVFSEIALKWSDEPAENIRFHVSRFDERFGLAMIAVVAPTLKGELRALRRPVQFQQSGYSEILGRVLPGEFAGCRALIIGGSRGLGEVTAKIICAGGGDVRLTYHRGARDAEDVVTDIAANGGHAAAFQYTVTDGGNFEVLFSDGNWVPTHTFYFPTPPIFTGSKGVFSSKLFNNFCDYFVVGFELVFSHLVKRGVLYYYLPSSSAIDEKPADMSEYIAAKSAAEDAARVLEKAHKGVTILQPRLPRLATDQTVTIIHTEQDDPVPIMLQQVRGFIRPT